MTKQLWRHRQPPQVILSDPPHYLLAAAICSREHIMLESIPLPGPDFIHSDTPQCTYVINMYMEMPVSTIQTCQHVHHFGSQRVITC